ncbi:hypothetical protein FE782_29515 [Paenibacillus antri]|uniref:ABM domain-containing protein n=1 Tax=Paenibacillus antri TaxID=2582848 RepID=A0A5R9GB92_9BACL|nr:hypothetical protein [Paenibacillus antri]TLS48675.1 hypothetical protein FE782_29515 [Paenibacillus antri]
MSTSLRSPTLELCICRPAPDLPDADFRKALRAADDFLAGRAGFEGRELLYSASSDRWIDLVRWASPDAAEAAMDDFGRVEALQPLACRLVDVTMLRLSRLPDLAVSGKAAGAGDAPVYEVIAYRLKPGIDDADYRRTLDAFGAATADLEGFLGRDVFLDASSGTWAEVVRYADQAAVDRLAPVVMSLPEAAAAMERIDAATVEIHFATQVRLT